MLQIKIDSAGLLGSLLRDFVEIGEWGMVGWLG